MLVLGQCLAHRLSDVDVGASVSYSTMPPAQTQTRVGSHPVRVYVQSVLGVHGVAGVEARHTCDVISGVTEFMVDVAGLKPSICVV